MTVGGVNKTTCKNVSEVLTGCCVPGCRYPDCFYFFLCLRSRGHRCVFRREKAAPREADRRRCPPPLPVNAILKGWDLGSSQILVKMH